MLQYLTCLRAIVPNMTSCGQKSEIDGDCKSHNCRSCILIRLGKLTPMIPSVEAPVTLDMLVRNVPSSYCHAEKWWSICARTGPCRPPPLAEPQPSASSWPATTLVLPPGTRSKRKRRSLPLPKAQVRKATGVVWQGTFDLKPCHLVHLRQLTSLFLNWD